MLKKVSTYFYRYKSSKSGVHLCFTFGLITLFVQICIFLIILYSMDNELRWNWYTPNPNFSDPVDDLDIIKQVFSDYGMPVYIIDNEFLKAEQYSQKNVTALSNQDCTVCRHLKTRTLELAVDVIIKKEVLNTFGSLGFQSTEFKSYKLNVPDLNREVTTAFHLKRFYSFMLTVLHRREDNVWWFGDINNDPNVESKLSSLDLRHSSMKHTLVLQHEGLLDKFDTEWRILSGTHLDFLYPKNIPRFLENCLTSRFVECNYKRARKFEKIHGQVKTTSAQRFRHKAWKLLSKAKAVLDSLHIKFWLSSGTLLGYARECGIIAHSRDVDLATMAELYSDSIEKVMANHSLKLIIRLGKPDDSLELSFSDQSGIKLDIFFFYKDVDGSLWNGGTQVKSGKKYKYRFPSIQLCWTLFQGLKVRVPCNTEQYIEANYGTDWFTPVTKWDWKTSPYNVQPNGNWPAEDWPQVIQVFHN